jgi:probable phosphoglycerate mutase
MEELTRLVLVRHAEAVCNVTGVVGGVRGCTGLTPSGRAQAERLAVRLARTGELGRVGALCSSVLPRAVETARILSPGLEGPGREAPEVEADCALCELHPGAADGLSWDELLSRFEAPDWDVDPSKPIAPGGETWTGFVARAAAALERLVEAYQGQTVVAVTHAGVIEASVLRFLPVDSRVARLGLHTAHASLTVWQHRGGPEGAAGRRWLLERYNDAATA